MTINIYWSGDCSETYRHEGTALCDSNAQLEFIDEFRGPVLQWAFKGTRLKSEVEV